MSNLREQIDADSLTEAEQRAILDQFRTLMQTGVADAQPLFERFIQRDDLLASVERDAHRIRFRRRPAPRLKVSWWMALGAVVLLAFVIVLALNGGLYDRLTGVYTLTVGDQPAIRVARASLRKSTSYSGWSYSKAFDIAPQLNVTIYGMSGWEQHRSDNGVSFDLPYENLPDQYLGQFTLELQPGSTSQSVEASAQDAASQCRQLGYLDVNVASVDQPATNIAQEVIVECRPLGRTDQNFPMIMGFRFDKLTNGQVVLVTVMVDKAADPLSEATMAASLTLQYMADAMSFHSAQATLEPDATTTPEP